MNSDDSAVDWLYFSSLVVKTSSGKTKTKKKTSVGKIKTDVFETETDKHQDLDCIWQYETIWNKMNIV